MWRTWRLVTRLFALLLLAGGTLAMRDAHAEIDRAQLVQAGASVLKVEAHRRQGGYSLGSGVMVAPDVLVTNCHVTREAMQVFVQRGGVRWRAQAQAVDIEHDLCLLRVPGLRAHTVVLGQAMRLKAGQSVTAVGFTGGMGIQTSAGEVVALHRMDGATVIQSTNWFTSGASGGALFDDDMRLVGVLTFRLLGGEAHYFAAPVEWLQALLNDDANFKPVAPLEGATLPYWEQPLKQQPRFLQAIQLERQGKWQELDSLASAWRLVDAGDVEACIAQGVALTGLGRLPLARRALEEALVLDPGSTSALVRLARVLARQGDAEAESDARRRLRMIDPQFLRHLDSMPAR